MGVSTCGGDSGSPLMKMHGEWPYTFYQYGIVHGMVGECGNYRYPSLFARIEDPAIHHFISRQLCNVFFL